MKEDNTRMNLREQTILKYNDHTSKNFFKICTRGIPWPIVLRNHGIAVLSMLSKRPFVKLKGTLLRLKRFMTYNGLKPLNGCSKRIQIGADCESILKKVKREVHKG